MDFPLEVRTCAPVAMSSYLKAFTVALSLSTAVVLCTTVELSESIQKRAQPEGVSISFYEDNVNWQDTAASGHSFAYIVATGGSSKCKRIHTARECSLFISDQENPKFSSNFADATAAGLIGGAYHISIFSQSTGADQAKFFVSNGGNWTADGKTLPGAIKVGCESQPSRSHRLTPIVYLTDDTDHDDCYGWDVTSTVNWIRDFSTTYYTLVHRYPVIHTTTHWWNACTGSNTEFGSSNPLWIVHQGDTVGALPAGWSDYTFWQYGNPVQSADGKERFNGDQAGLKR